MLNLTGEDYVMKVPLGRTSVHFARNSGHLVTETQQGDWGQLVEQWCENQKVSGSIPRF